MKNYFFFLVVIILTACTGNSDPCPNADHPIDDIFTSFATSSEYVNLLGFNTEIHEYSFKFSIDGTICSIGYLAHKDVDSYDIQIVDKDNLILADESIKFPSDVLGFRPITNIEIKANEIYTIRRICKTYDNEDQLAGSVLKANNVPIGIPQLGLPLSNGNFTVTSVAFYGKNDEIPNAIPRIELGFESL